MSIVSIIRYSVIIVVAYVLIGPDTIGRLISGALGPGEKAVLIAKLAGAGAAIGVFHLPFPQHHGKGWHIIGWSIGSAVLLLTFGLWFPAVISLGEHAILLGDRLVPPPPALPPAGP